MRLAKEPGEFVKLLQVWQSCKSEPTIPLIEFLMSPGIKFSISIIAVLSQILYFFLTQTM
jgi:hypothetical protein